MKLRPITKWLLFIIGVFVAIQVLFPSPALQPDDPPKLTSIADKEPPKPSKVFEVVSVDPKFPKFERALIQEAAYNWEFYSSDLAKFKLTTGDPLAKPIEMEPGQKGQAIFIRPIHSYDIKTQLIDILIGGTALGFYDPSTPVIPTIWIVQDRIQFDYEYEAVVMHELGHSLGLQHEPLHEDTLMYPEIQGIMCITQWDLKKFCKIYGCDTEEMDFCYPRTEGPACLAEESSPLSQIFSSP
jgi:hypothetical protein